LSGVLIEPVALSELDENKLLLQSGFWGSFKVEFGWLLRNRKRAGKIILPGWAELYCPFCQAEQYFSVLIYPGEEWGREFSRHRC
jgi:hypothetical protein